MRVALVLGLGMLTGCAAERVEPRVSGEHPASVEAAAAPEQERSGLLSEREPMGEARAGVPAPAAGAHGGHADHREPAPAAAARYSCPMHPEVVSDEPGRCPKCGMALVEKEGGR